MNALTQALVACSPRHTPTPTPLRAFLIHGSVLTLWLLLFASAFMLGGVYSWSVGIAYILYDTLLLLFVSWQLRGLRRPENAVAAKSPTTLTAIVAAYNEAAVLPITLAALLRQTDSPDQIIIADDGSSDGTEALLGQHYGLLTPALNNLSAPSTLYPTLRWLRVPRGGKARALNAAVQLAQTDVVLTVDADTLLDTRAIAAFRNAFAREPELVAATGVLTPVCDGSFGAQILQWFQTYEYIRNFLSRYAWMRAESLLLISGAFAGFRRHALLEVGGFDPDCLVEDYELVHRLRYRALSREQSWKFRVLGDAQARTDAPGSIYAFLRQRQRWFGGFLQTQYWYRAMVGDGRYGLLGSLMLPVKAVDALQPLYGLTAFALLTKYLLTGRFSVLLPVSGLIAGKIAIDFAFHLASVQWYRRWVNDGQRGSYAAALAAALLEPFSFQLLRHSGAALGWWSFLFGHGGWATQSRKGLLASESRGD